MQTLFSEHWHAVRNLRPRLRDGVQPLPRRLRGQPWVLLHDPVTQRFVRITPAVWRTLQLLDGRRTLDEVWAAACAAAGTEGTAISQHELVQLLGQLYSNDLLQSQAPPDSAEVFERWQRQRRAKLKQSFLNPMSIKLPLFQPDAWFERRKALAARMFSWTSLLLWLAVVLPASVLAWQEWEPLTNNLSDRVLSASNLALLWFTYPAVKALHECAHGLAVKAWGGTVREIGVMFVMFTPVPYVDATSSYAFPSKWARAAVAAAGIMAELVVGALALYVWMMAEPGIVTAVAFNVVLIAGASTLLVNGNPLMRYDGYFILCDLLELPNLSQRATQYWTYLSDRWFFGARDAQPPLGSERERAWLFGYGLVAPVYRIFITVGLIWFVAGEYFFLGVLMALGAAWMSLAMPLWKGWKHVHEGGSLGRRREPAQRRLYLAVVVLVLLLGVVPLPFYSVHQAVVWLPDEAIVRAELPGQVTHAVRPAAQVLPRQPLAVLDNPEALSDWQVASASVELLRSRVRQAEVDDRSKAEGLRRELAAATAKEQETARRLQSLRLAGGVAGTWVPAAATELDGRYVKRGEIVGYVVDGPSRLLRVAVTQEDMDLIASRLRGVQARLLLDQRRTTAARVTRRVPGGSETLISAALGSSGGGAIAVDPSQGEGTKALHKVFDLELQLDAASPRSVFGDRAYVRFDLGWAPLGWQWALRLRQVFLSRFYV